MNNINSSSLTTTASIIIENVNIRQDSQGRFCLNDLHKAAGGLKKSQPSDFLRLTTTQALVAEISTPGIPGLQENQALSVINGGPDRGTYVCKELVYAYGMWISPAFHLKVIRTFDDLVTGRLKVQQEESNLLSRALIIADKRLNELLPKAAFVDNYIEANGTLGLREAAKTLNIKPNYFTQKLREERILYYNVKKQNVATQAYMDRGYFVVKTALNSANEMVYQSTRVTPRGMEWLAKRFAA
ncbi:phage antirepressor KilAC domain-containing protein [Endozoicomonas sp. SM1973]|uniref:Phage antirepressor KilAC domain-containing protein n=1 Tax=Spartinivicinus marinus TaxID=2994442 RepID=A0A853IHY2_9GAMM|nr:phage antirepressor KilAC domain-containing protein [Spartinivicinus marinus]MCX4024774.1 phage antirepressor KilAC domain-containing protein [Spartinivicinus marinus]NYZ68725.1 phage antirepressor KilAC domain-containing protein [Spartinivicinus marinus]